MISVAEAKRLLIAHSPTPQSVSMPLASALGYVLATDLFAPMDMPAFAQSAMDGYALAFESLRMGQPLPVSHTIQAGATDLPVLQPGEAMRIFTGAPIPQGADTVVMQEKVCVDQAGILVLDQELQPGSNVRPRASQTAQGELAAKKGTRLTPGSIGLLAGLGIAEVQVFATPRTGIIVTGKELVTPGEPLQLGQVYESNSVMLCAALSEAGIFPELLRKADDVEAQIYAAIAEALASCSLVLITGGISVGDYDFVYQALQKAGVETIFYKIKQKPGKPLYCGRRGNTLVFGLPGNPGSVLSCFYQYVVPAIRQLKGQDPTTESPLWKTLAEDYTKKPGLTQFLKAKYQGDWVSLLPGQESYKLSAFVESNCLVELEEAKGAFKKGEQVRVYPLDQCWL